MNLLTQFAQALLIFALFMAVGVLGLDAWQWENLGHCDGCVILDKVRDLR